MPWLGTFHSIGARILRRHAELVGLRPDFTILDTDDQIRLIKQLLEAENIDEKRWPARQFAGDDGRLEEPRAAAQGRLARPTPACFANGQGAKSSMPTTRRGSRRSTPPISATCCSNASACSARTRTCSPSITGASSYMLVDEYQDSNVAQYLWLRLLAQGKPASRGQYLRRRRRRPVDLWLARRRGRQHPALREGFSRRQGDPARTQLPLDLQHPRGRLAT